MESNDPKAGKSQSLGIGALDLVQMKRTKREICTNYFHLNRYDVQKMRLIQNLILWYRIDLKLK